MKKRFNRERVRCHVYDPGILVIQGWFEGDHDGKEQFSAFLGNQKLPAEVSVQQGIEIRKKYLRYKSDISVEYFLWITLPKTLDGGTLHVFHEAAKGRCEIWKGSARSVKRMQGRLDAWVETLLSGTEGKLTLRGWLISPETYRIALLGKGGTPLETSIETASRMDVKSEYPEVRESHIYGFEIKFARPQVKTLRLVLQNRQKKNLQVICVERMLENKSSLANLYQKGMIYLKSKGVKPFLKRTWEKALKLDEASYGNFRRKYEPKAAELKAQREHKFAKEPLISIVVPLYKTKEAYLKDLVDSVKRQTYGKWELCLSDGSGADSPLQGLLKKMSLEDSRIRVICNGKQLRISENTNAAIQAAKGDFIAFADHDDLLAEHALFECVKRLNEDPEVDFLYTDEDKVSMDGKKFFQPHFKSDYNPDLLCSMNYFCHLVVVKRSLQQEVGLLDPEFDGAQDYDFVLRCTEKSRKIAHIPKVLYHWRAHEDSTAENPESKQYAFTAGMRAIQAHYDRMGIRAVARQGEYPGLYISDYEISGEPLVSIMIPNKDHIADLKKCIDAIEEKSDYRNYEYVIIENNSTEAETFAYYEKLTAENPKAHVVCYQGEFNYSDINNFGVSHAKGDYYWFLNNDTQIIGADCLRQLLGYCTREDVGAVGARLYYEDNTIQHAGVILGFGGIAGHAFIGSRRGENGYFSRIICAQDLSAVTAACMMVKAEVFQAVGGFTKELRVAFNDIDLCMKIREYGKRIVYNPYAQLYHFESKSRGAEDTQEKVERFNGEIALFMQRWAKQVTQGDPYYNPNLSLDKADFSLKM